VWLYLTTKWFSLRLPDNEKAERKTIHPFWCAVQECFKQNHPGNEVKRFYGQTEAISPEWHLSHLDGCLSSFAALLGITNRDDALHELQRRLTQRNNATDFETACIKKPSREEHCLMEVAGNGILQRQCPFSLFPRIGGCMHQR